MALDEAKLQTLIDKQDITDVIMRYCRALDRADKDLMRTVFWEDATDDHGLNGVVTREQFVESAIDYLSTAWTRTAHNITTLLIEVDGDRATAESYFIAWHRRENENEDRYDDWVAGRYLDDFEKRNGEWRIRHRHAVYDWAREEPGTRQWWDAFADQVVFGARKPDDVTYTK